MKRLSLPQTRNLIYATGNRTLFKQGSTFSEHFVLDWFGIKTPDFSQLAQHEIVPAASKLQLQKLSAQTQINKVLAKRGLYMGQHQNTSYKIKTLQGSIKQTAAFGRSATAKLEKADDLNKGIKGFQAKLSIRVSNSELEQ